MIEWLKKLDKTRELKKQIKELRHKLELQEELLERYETELNEYRDKTTMKTKADRLENSNGHLKTIIRELRDEIKQLKKQ